MLFRSQGAGTGDGDHPRKRPTPEPLIESFFENPPGGPPVVGTLHRPPAEPGDALVLTHGAGSNRDAPLLGAVATAFASAGDLVLRCDLPFRQARPTGPPYPATAGRDREGLRRAVEAVRRMVPGRVFLGGHSYGGRQASLLASDDPALSSGLLLLAYPLRPPRGGEPRTAHFPGLHIPSLFVHGSRDPFGTIEDIRAALVLIPAPTALLPVEGAGHDLLTRRRTGAAPLDVPAAALAAFRRLVGCRSIARPLLDTPGGAE